MASFPKPIRYVLEGDFSTPAKLVAYELNADVAVPPGELDERTVDLVSIHAKSGGNDIRIYWGQTGDSADPAHLIEVAADGVIDKEFHNPNIAPKVPKGFGGGAGANALWVAQAGAGTSSVVIYANAR